MTRKANLTDFTRVLFNKRKLQFISDHGSSARQRSGLQLQHAARSPNKRRQPVRNELAVYPFDTQLPIEKSDIDRKTHAERVNSLGGIDPKALAPFELVALQQTNTSRTRAIRQPHKFSEGYTARSIFDNKSPRARH